MTRLALIPLVVLASAVFAEMEPATPESQGVDSAAIIRWIDAFERKFDGGSLGAPHGFVIVRHGKVIAEGSWAPFDTLEETHMLYSHSKSFTATAVGFLVDDGKLDLDGRVVDLFPEDVPADACAEIKAMRVRDLLTMNTGSDQDHTIGKERKNWTKAFFAKKFVRWPGMGFKYDSDATYMLAAIVEKTSGMKLMDFLKLRLFDRIGITKAWSTVSPEGVACGGWGMNMTTRELARFGQFYLQRGLWNGERLLSPDWIALATTRQTWSEGIAAQAAVQESGSDWKQGYGFQFWRCRHGAYRADGAAGQYTVVMPEQDAVVSVHAGCADFQAELDILWEHLLPAMSDGPLPENPEAAKMLSKRCSRLKLAPVKGVAKGVGAVCGKTFEFKENHRGIRSVRIEKDDELWCRLVTPAGEQEFPVGFGQWKKGRVRIDTQAFEGLGDYVGEFDIATSGAVDESGMLRIIAYLTGTTGKLVLSVGANGASGEFWAMNGAKLEAK